MASPSQRFIFVFNGEIYNHLEIRQQLSFTGFHGTSDTETIAVALDEWGLIRTISALDGMFALGIFDQQEQNLHLVRDFAGIKPLFFGSSNGAVVFASQYDQVAAHPAIYDEPVDSQVLNLYLQQHFLPAPFGLLKNTWQVRPGELVTINNEGNVHKERYWELPEEVSPTVSDHSAAIELIESELDAAVQAEMLSDVPLGTFLSGGVDSPLITYFASNHVKQGLQSFSIGSDSVIHDESDFAQRYAQLIGVEQFLEKMDSGKASHILDSVMQSMHEPMADFSIIPTFLVSKLAKQHVTVSLSGDGADELFFGYDRFWSVAKNRKFQQWPYPLKWVVYGIDKIYSNNNNINSGIFLDSQGLVHQKTHNRFPPSVIESVVPGLLKEGLPSQFVTFQYSPSSSFQDLMCRMRKAEFYWMMQKTLRKVDLASMANSLEVRVPFLKKSFIEASLKINPLLSAGPNIQKQLLKDLLRKKIPQSPIFEQKRGFTIPLSKWIRKQLGPSFEQILLQDTIIDYFGMSKDTIVQLLQEHKQGKANHKWVLFTLFALFHWKQNVDRVSRADVAHV